MDENSYEYQCMRAELLGVERPSLDDFLSNQKKRQEAEHVEQEEVDVENLKASCGSLTNLLKIRIGTASGSNESIILNSNSSNANQEVTGLDNTSLADSPKKIAGDDEVRKSDLADALDNHVDKLDLLIENAENCQYSMSEQNKQMKKFLR
ncbi:uncharacterized protein LOC116162021 isoform X2 [Photinus pyralis]|uniref:uncharacterized protein LOC116161944 isoform X2 n=1 Tax=Photinus pyralis TaxID=7054 RepID=UPI00126728E0|nr:uncharacterized protein LOC116161944 isoform X2 [Photinus pyralis]XP_031331398.1 uncharacterized protein LOC116162021 isoform X2 [Photinus pyralis]